MRRRSEAGRAGLMTWPTTSASPEDRSAKDPPRQASSIDNDPGRAGCPGLADDRADTAVTISTTSNAPPPRRFRCDAQNTPPADLIFGYACRAAAKNQVRIDAFRTPRLLFVGYRHRSGGRSAAPQDHPLVGCEIEAVPGRHAGPPRQ